MLDLVDLVFFMIDFGKYYFFYGYIKFKKCYNFKIYIKDYFY